MESRQRGTPPVRQLRGKRFRIRFVAAGLVDEHRDHRPDRRIDGRRSRPRWGRYRSRQGQSTTGREDCCEVRATTEPCRRLRCRRREAQIAARRPRHDEHVRRA